MMRITLVSCLGLGAIVVLASAACGSAFNGAGGAGGATSVTTTATTDVATTTVSTGGAGGTSSITATGPGGDAVSSSSGAMTEDCFNGVDDNGDGKKDCADPQCATTTHCFDAAPSWDGPFYAAFGGQSGMAGTCPTSFQGSQVLREVINPLPLPTCTCGCSGDADVCLAGFKVGAGSCDSNAELLHAGEGCVALVNATIDDMVETEDATSGLTNSCMAAQANQPPPYVLGPALFCTSSDASGCGGQKTCLPSGDPDFFACVSRDGDVPCPIGYGVKHLVTAAAGDQVTDTRGCDTTKPCSCLVDGADCDGTVEFFDDSICATTEVASLPTGTDCTGLNGAAATILGVRYSPTSAGTCTPKQQGAPTGTISPLTTVCCAP